MIQFDIINKLIICCLSICLVFLGACVPVLPQSTKAIPPEPIPEQRETINHPPVIELISAPDNVSPSSNNRINCEAVDIDGDSLSYAWNITGGSIFGEGNTITWIAPEIAGTYQLSVAVTDGEGGKAEDTASINVSSGPNHPPTMSLNVTQKGKAIPGTKSIDEPADVRVWSVLKIECTAQDPDGDALSYTWSATGGILSGEGPVVEYIARDRGEQIITVTVADTTGRQVSSKIYLHVECCGR